MELPDKFSSCASLSDMINIESNVSAPLFSRQPIDPGFSILKPVTLWPGMYHSPVTKALWEARSNALENTPIESSEECEMTLTAKTPSESRTSIMYKFSSDVILREQYRNPWNEIRMGKVIEDLDVLAGVISFKHCCKTYQTQRPLLLVTASVDKLMLKKPIHVDRDLTISGAVIWVGRSSVEIQLEIVQSLPENQQDSLVALVANFTFVARDSGTGKPVPINPISPETERERLLWQEAQERNGLRKNKKDESTVEINEETTKLNTLLAERQLFVTGEICRENSMICQPQHRNTQGRIFGGFLMRRAFELAFATAYAYVGAKPVFIEIDHVNFLRPVDVGDFLRYKSCILFGQPQDRSVFCSLKPIIRVEVVAHVTKPELGTSEISNEFYFTFGVHSMTENGSNIGEVRSAPDKEAAQIIF